jgi:hypothetical protein
MDPINVASKSYRLANALSKGKFFKSLGSFLNMGKWAENAAAGFGMNVRNAGKVTPYTGMGGATSTFIGPETRTATGYGATTLGNILAYGSTVGPIAYGMSSHGEAQQSHDQNGVKMKGYNEELGKARAKFQMEKLGGSKEFSKEKYQHLREQASWVDSAIGEIGKENYIKYREALMRGEISGQQMHDVLTNALASIGDEESLKEASKDAYVLPGIARNQGGQGRFIVIQPIKGKNKDEVNFQALKYGISDLNDGGQEGQ